MSESKLKDKPFAISKRVVWDAYQRVKANDGAAGVDGESIEEFERDLKGNLYKLWNRLSSGSYFPAPVRAVEIPKKHGSTGVRVLGVPSVADRIAQTVVRLYVGSVCVRSNRQRHNEDNEKLQRCVQWAPVTNTRVHAGLCSSARNGKHIRAASFALDCAATAANQRVDGRLAHALIRCDRLTLYQMHRSP